ncbi:MAG: hypothetical protein WC760_11170 [Bacteroidia bacterium]|jgi:hypothetical protein
MKWPTILALLFCLFSFKVEPQNYLNVYLPFYQVSYSNANDYNSPVFTTPYSAELSGIRDIGIYWHLNADALTQLMLPELNHSKKRFSGDVIHGRLGLVFPQLFSQSNHGLAFDVFLRTNEYFGTGLSYFQVIEPESNRWIFKPQVALGNLTRAKKDDIPNHDGMYVSAEMDITVKMGKTTGISFKPYSYLHLSNGYVGTQVGLRIGLGFYHFDETP